MAAIHAVPAARVASVPSPSALQAQGLRVRVAPALAPRNAAARASSSSVSPRDLRVRAVSAEASAEVGEVVELEIEKPYGIKFFRGADNCIYIDALLVGGPALALGKLQEGDKLLATTGVFGTEMWPAADYGRTMYTIQNRVGPMIFRFEKKNGVKIGPYRAEAYLQERAAGNVGDAVREKQVENWAKVLEGREKREEEMSAGLGFYREGKYEMALRRFENLLTMKPEYKETGVAFYNIACCCAKLGLVEAGLEALEGAMKSGFDDYKAIRSDSDLAGLRNSDKFFEVLDKYDEPIINQDALKAISGLFGIFGKK